MANTTEYLQDLGDVTHKTVATSLPPVDQQLIIAKVVAMIVLGLASFALGVLPVKLATWLHWNKEETKSPNLIISLLLCFGGGVLLYTTFLHLQPEVREGIAYLQRRGQLPNYGHGIHLAELIFCGGFFFVYLVEELVHAVLDRRPHEREDEAVLHRTMSLRRCSKHPNTHDENGTLIPRVNLNKPASDNHSATNQSTGSISASTQGLLHPSSVSIAVEKPVVPEVIRVPRSVNHHGHSHAIPFKDDDSLSINSSTVAKSFRGLLAVLALSFHAVFEGLAVGLEAGVANVWYLFAAIATHKLVIAFCVGIELVSSRTKLFLIVIYLATFAAVTPLGIGVGIALSGQEAAMGGVVTVVLQGMAAGTLLYVVFFEVLQRERANTQMGIWQLFAIMAGFAVMFALQLATGHDHSHGTDDDHDHGDHDHAHEDHDHVVELVTKATQALLGLSHDHEEHEDHHH